MYSDTAHIHDSGYTVVVLLLYLSARPTGSRSISETAHVHMELEIIFWEIQERA